MRHVSRARSTRSSDVSAALAPVMTVVRTRRTRSVAACRTSSKRKPPSMRARGLGVGEYCEEERPCLQLRSSTGSSSPACVLLAAGGHPTAYSPRRRPLRASRDESRKSEHVTARGLNAATRDMAAIAEAARCAASKWAAKKFHCYMPNTTTWQEAKPLTLEGAPRRARGKISSSRARSRATRSL